MANKPNRVSAESCRKLADAILNVRNRAIVSERWIETQLGQTLDSHDWRPGRPGHVNKLAKQIAKLVYNGPADRDALAKKIAGLTQQDRVREVTQGFFKKSGLAIIGVPVDHAAIGREELMAAMLSRFVYGEDRDVYVELEEQGVYTLLKSEGPGHVNRSFLLVESLHSKSVIWAAHLYRTAGASAELKVRMGVFLSGPPHTALLSMARWAKPGAILGRHLSEEDAQSVEVAIELHKMLPAQSHSLAVLNFKAADRAELIDEHGLKAIGVIPPKDQPEVKVALDAIGLVPRAQLSDLEAARTPPPKAEHAQAYAEVQDALARFAAIAAVPGLNAFVAEQAAMPDMALDNAQAPDVSGALTASDPAQTPESSDLPDSLDAPGAREPQTLDADAPACIETAPGETDGQPLDGPVPTQADGDEPPPGQSS